RREMIVGTAMAPKAKHENMIAPFPSCQKWKASSEGVISRIRSALRQTIARMPTPSAISFEPLALAPPNLMSDSQTRTASEALWNDEQASITRMYHPLGETIR